MSKSLTEVRALLLARINEATRDSATRDVIGAAVCAAFIKSTQIQEVYIKRLSEILTEMREISKLKQGVREQQRLVELSHEIRALHHDTQK